MNILLYDMGSYIQQDLLYYLKSSGHNCKNLLYKLPDYYQDDFFEWKFSKYLENDYWDCVMSTNFFPIVAKLCNKYNKTYIAWSYDSPVIEEWYQYFGYDTNYIFLFDRIDVEKANSKGYYNVFHLPLAVNTKRLTQLKPTREQIKSFTSDFSFVGRFYTNNLHKILSLTDDYTKGYIEALVKTQLKIYGYNFISEMITDTVCDNINKQLSTYTTEMVTPSGIINSIEKQVTHTERIVLCKVLSGIGTLKYYSGEAPEELKHLTWNGTANYLREMPLIFKLSKFNLNPSLRSIQSGIPLRALDIMGSNGTLFSNYQPELAEYFQDGKSVILYESLEDAIEKAHFYLTHEDIRQNICKEGYNIVNTNFTYPERISYMLKIATS